MMNPFSTPLAVSGFGPNTGFDFPSVGDAPVYTTENEPDLTGLGGGVSAYRGNQSDHQKVGYPAYAGADQLGYMNAPGVENIYQGTNPAAGSADLAFPRYDGGKPGTDRVIHSVGPVDGNGTEYYDGQTPLNTPNPNYAGPVAGGPDYANTAAANYFASQAQAYSEQASASALIAAF